MELDTNIEYAGFWNRFGAFVIDFIVLVVLLGLIKVLLLLTFSEGVAELVVDSFGVWVVPWVYFAGLHSSSWQATIGKRYFRLKVVDYSEEGISFGRATGRFFARSLSALIAGIGYMMVGWTKRKQGLHDFIAKTLVVEVQNV